MEPNRRNPMNEIEAPLAPGACCETAPCSCQDAPIDRLAEIQTHAADLAARLTSAEAQLQLVDQRYGAVHEALTLWRSGDIDADEAMRRIHDALGTPAIPGKAA